MGLRNMTPIIVPTESTHKEFRMPRVVQNYDIQTCKLLDVSKRELGILKISICYQSEHIGLYGLIVSLDMSTLNAKLCTCLDGSKCEIRICQ